VAASIIDSAFYRINSVLVIVEQAWSCAKCKELPWNFWYKPSACTRTSHLEPRLVLQTQLLLETWGHILKMF